MWKYLRRLSIHPETMYISFAGERLEIAPNGCVLSPVSSDLKSKMLNAPHVFVFDSSLVAPSPKEEIVVESPKKRRRTKKTKTDEG